MKTTSDDLPAPSSAATICAISCRWLLIALLVGATCKIAHSQPRAPDLEVPSETQFLAAIKAFGNSNAPPGSPHIRELLGQEQFKRTLVIQELLAIFNDPNSNNFTKGFAAYRLGLLQATEAVDSLAANITNTTTVSSSPDTTDAPWWGHTAAEALVKIGTPSIPAVIRNLAESDDPAIRGVSLGVLRRIEGDDNIVQLRIQNAVKTEKNLEKKDRLKSVLKTLAAAS